MSIRFQSSDGLIVVVGESLLTASEFVARSLIALRGHNGEVPSSSSPLIYVGSIHSTTLENVMKWIHHHQNQDAETMSPTTAFGASNNNSRNGDVYLDGLDLNTLHEMREAAKLLEIRYLIEWTTLRMAEIVNEPVEACTAEIDNDVNEVESAASSSPDVFNLLPEIWDSILPHFTGNDFESLIHSDLRWRSMFMSRRVDGLLPLWLPIYFKQCGVSNAAELLFWRTVSKSARSVVENLLEESVSPENCYSQASSKAGKWTPVGENAEEDLRLAVVNIKSRFEFSLLSQIQDFMNKVNSPTLSSSVNPFLTKSLVINITNEYEFTDENGDPILPKITPWNEPTLSMITRFGHEIAAFRFCADVPGPARLLFFLGHMPNLKVLTLDAEIYLSVEATPENLSRWASRLNLEQLEFLNIEELAEHWSYNGATVVSQILPRCGPRLERLACSRFLFTSRGVLKTLCRERLPNLRFLQAGSLDANFLNNFARLDLPLEEIQFKSVELFVVLTLSDVLLALRRFADTLVSLKLTLKLKDEEEVTAIQANPTPFPNLSRFSADLSSIRTNWFRAFVQLQAQQLTELNLDGIMEDRLWHGPVTYSSVQQEDIDELLQLFESVPNLKIITIFCGAFRRLGFGFAYSDSAEKIVIERSGTVRSIELNKLIND